jgi:hypothetical protein
LDDAAPEETSAAEDGDDFAHRRNATVGHRRRSAGGFSTVNAELPRPFSQNPSGGQAEVAREIWTGALSGEAARDRQEDC